MNVFFDNCTAPVLASTLDGFIAPRGHHAFHIKDVPGLTHGRNATDLEWIDRLRSDNLVWIFITGDGRVLKNAAERQALRSAGLHGFVLAPAYQKTPLHQVASLLVWKWPDIEKTVSLLEPPAMHEVSMRRDGRLKPLPL